MNKSELALQLAERLGLHKKQSEDIIDAIQELITAALARRQEVTIAGFGTFSSRVRTARMGVNPRKPSERIRVPEVLVPKFKAGQALKKALKDAHAARGSSSVVTPVSSMSPRDDDASANGPTVM